jgi:tRNA (Thr-GGU) A37 N-methylase
MTVCPILRVDQAAGSLEVAAIDALDGTAVLDVKPYYGCCDRVREPRTPSWLPDWGEWIPEGGIGMDD